MFLEDNWHQIASDEICDIILKKEIYKHIWEEGLNNPNISLIKKKHGEIRFHYSDFSI